MIKIPAYILLIILVFACAPRVKREETVKPIPLPREEQEKKALEAFNKILELTETGSREEILPRLEIAYIEEAEVAYKNFINSYPDSPFKKEIEDTMVRFYYTQRLWDKLLKIEIPYIKEYVKTGELRTPVHLFYYSEAKYGLGDYKEAEKGFRTIITLFPTSSEAYVAKKGLKKSL